MKVKTMPSRDEILYDKTYKGQVDNAGQRVFYTLSDKRGTESHRTTKLLAVLVQHFVERDVINEDELDKMLLSLLN